MEPILDTELLNSKQDQIIYGAFWPRLGALLLDGIILSPVAVGLTFFNILHWKSTLLLILISLIGISYKPFCEYKYGATLGKMALKLKVVNLQFDKASLTEILLRNIFQILSSLISLVLLINVFSLPEFQDITGFMEYSVFISKIKYINSSNWILYILYFIDVIFLWSDKKQKRSLHDRIGKTYVIVRAS